MKEEWKQITEMIPKRGMTEVSSLGRVRKTFSWPSEYKRKPKKPVVKYYTPKLAKGCQYLYLYVQSFTKRTQLHQIIYLAFKGEIPEGYVIDHVDGNKLNNSISNLEAVTRKENAKRWSDKQKKKGIVNLKGKCRKGHDKKGARYCKICRKENRRTKPTRKMPDGNWIEWNGYMVSDQGEVWSPYHKILRKKSLSSKGYYFIMFNPSFRERTGKMNWSVHRIVYEAWKGSTDKVIDHVDGNRLNNKLSNLEAVTQSENIKRYWDRRKKKEEKDERRATSLV